MSLAHLRNLGIVAHIDAGKTTVSERVLFYAGIERRMGEVHEGSAVMDWMEEERKRGITIVSAATVVPWRDHQINLIDTPGHVDFTVEVERCMRVLDGAVLVVNGVAGVQAQSETVWRQMQRHHVRSIAFVNQLDRPGADFLHCVKDLRDRLRAPAIPLQYPVGEGRAFRTVVDLLAGRALQFDEEDLGREPHAVPIPPEVADEVGVLRAELLERLSEEDDAVLAALLEEREPAPEALRRALRRRVAAGTLVPVLCGAALRNVGIQPLLDAVVDYLPAPDEVPPQRGHDPKSGAEVVCDPDPDAPVCAYAFKLQSDPSEDLLFTRIYAGTIEHGKRLLNPRLGRMERIARVLRLHADTRLAVESAGPGEIVALTGCKLTGTGDTLCEHERQVVLEPLTFPDPVITRVVEPASTADRERLRAALERLAYEDPSFHLREDEDTGQWQVLGMGELHLEIKEHRLRDEFGLEVRVGQPRVAYREAPSRVAEGSARVERVLGGHPVFGAVTLEVHPVGEEESQEGAVVPPLVEWAEGVPVPPAVRAAVAEALTLELQVGPRFGFPLILARVRVTGGEPPRDGHDAGRDPELGYVTAASQALRAALGRAAVQLLEPRMAFEVAAPAEFMSGILGELNAKHAEVSELAAEGDLRRVRGTVSLARMFGYATTLRSLSQGRASFSLTPAGFQVVPEAELAERGLVWT